MRRNLGLLVGAGLGFWLALFYPARLFGGDSAVIFSAVAWALCLVPAAATLMWSQKAFTGTPEQQFLAVMGGTAVRMVFVIGAGMALFSLSDYFHYPSFLVWVVMFYLVTLAVEISLLLTGRSAHESSQNKG